MAIDSKLYTLDHKQQDQLKLWNLNTQKIKRKAQFRQLRRIALHLKKLFIINRKVKEKLSLHKTQSALHLTNCSHYILANLKPHGFKEGGLSRSQVSSGLILGGISQYQNRIDTPFQNVLFYFQYTHSFVLWGSSCYRILGI